MADNDNGKIELMGNQLAVIQSQMEQMVQFMARQTDAMERLARIEERESAHAETVRRLWARLERQDRIIEEQDKGIDELERDLNKRLHAIEQELTRHGVFTSGAQAVLAVLLSGGVSLAVGLLLQ